MSHFNELDVLVDRLLHKYFWRKIAIIFLSISLNMSFEYTQYMFWLRNRKNTFSYTLLSERPADSGLFQNLFLQSEQFVIFQCYILSHYALI